ncbi:MAG: NAD-dependent epimerase/dehydratase [Candidatus Roizmanbacteria bacterium GW2011_GWC2_41_7]|nr:MAG: NAD-dependent epimerase/dehydratase [Candidatus Roizmanbacteria bacterium GW2011_GWC2_41_7]
MKHIAITGGSGFIGTFLVEKLKQRRVSYTLLNRKKHNLLYPNSLKDFVSSKDAIIHLAAKDKDSGLTEMMKTNIGGTMGLMGAIKQWNPSVKLIAASSFLVYIPEDAFGATKKAAEELIEEYGKQLPIKVAILRFSNIYGPGGKPFHNSVISTFVHLIKKGKK